MKVLPITPFQGHASIYPALNHRGACPYLPVEAIGVIIDGDDDEPPIYIVNATDAGERFVAYAATIDVN